MQRGVTGSWPFSAVAPTSGVLGLGDWPGVSHRLARGGGSGVELSTVSCPPSCPSRPLGGFLLGFWTNIESSENLFFSHPFQVAE